jgi:hypothetical protein
MYKKLGAEIQEEWHNCDFNEKEIMEFQVR